MRMTINILHITRAGSADDAWDVFSVGVLPEAARRNRTNCDHSHPRQRESIQRPGKEPGS